MSLTLGSGPFSGNRAGAFNFSLEDAPGHQLYWDPFPRRMRALVGGHTILDSTRGHLLFESNIPPRYYLPLDDLDQDVLEASGHTTHCPFKGDASYYSVRVGDRLVENAVWYYPEPIAEAPWLAGHASVYPGAPDLWLQEDEPIREHLRDPYHRVEVLESSRRVKVTAGGVTIAESDRPKLVFETGAPMRVYLLRSDVLPGILEPSDTTRECPYKGHATYWHLRAGDVSIDDAAWSYEAPLHEAVKAQSHLSFEGEGVEVSVS
jgi:uncharacterized protein (DUF427 family)